MLAVGCTTHFFGVAGAEQHAISLDSVWQAERFRRKLLRKCAERNEHARASIASPVKVVIIGAGATGVELAAELEKTARVLLDFGLYGADDRSDIHVTIVEGGPRILPALSPRVSTATTKLLGKLNVELLTSSAVNEVHAHGVTTSSGMTVPENLIVWAAGIKGHRVMGSLDGLAVNRLNQLKVTRSLQSEEDPNVFALGDCASCEWEQGRTVPPRA